jgi:type II secretory pathway pseudopilin PulG
MCPEISKKKLVLLFPIGKKGFTQVQLIGSIITMVVAAVIAFIGFQIFVSKARVITIQHDLQNFVQAQESYRADHGQYLGAMGDFIQYGQPPSGTLAIPDLSFTMSDGIRIEITSGNGQNHLGPPAFKAVAKHARSNITYEYDFSTKQTTRKEKLTNGKRR